MRYAIVNKKYVEVSPNTSRKPSTFRIDAWSRAARKAESRAKAREIKKQFKVPTDYYIVDTFMREVVR